MDPFSFHKIEGTAGWYYNKWPGFLTVDAYQIIQDYSDGKLNQPSILNENKKRRFEDDDPSASADIDIDEGVEETKDTDVCFEHLEGEFETTP